MFQTLPDNAETKIYGANDPAGPELGAEYYSESLRAFVMAVRYNYTDLADTTNHLAANRTVKKFAVLATDDAAAILAATGKTAPSSDEFVVTTYYAGARVVGGDGKHIGKGMMLGTPTIELPVFYVQTSGFCEFTAGVANIIAGDYLVPDNTEDGDLEEGNGTPGDSYAQAVDTVGDGSTGTCKLRNLR